MTAEATLPDTGGFPKFSTTFVGRDSEIEAILAMLDRPECRLLTIIGPGGAGKTRLAAEVSARLQASHHRLGYHFVDLSAVEGSDAPALAIADAFGVSLPQVDGNGDELLAEALRDKAAVAVLDNFEHLVDTCAEPVGLMAAQCPEIRFIVTSRVALNVQHEWRFYIEGLTADGGEREAARRLFLDRAARVSGRPETDFDAGAVDAICKAVGGMPLALEMAAAWTRSMSEADIAEELQRRLDLLTTNMRDLPERQRSMEAVFDQSCKMLNEQERMVFARLGVFSGSFTRGAAIEVAGASLSILATLVDHSLVTLEPGGRYRLHQLLRQYARNSLEQEGLLAPTEADHSRYYLRLLRRQMVPVRGHHQVHAIAELEPDHDNLLQAWKQAAAAQAVDAGLAEDAVEASVAMGMFLDATSRYQEGHNWSHDVLRLAPKAGEHSATLEAIGLVMRGGTHIRLGNVDEAERDLLDCTALCHREDVSMPRSLTTNDRSLHTIVQLVRGQYQEAVETAEDAELLTGEDDPWGKAVALYCLGGAYFGLGEYSKARSATARALEYTRASGDQWFADYLYLQDAECALQQGMLDEAARHAEIARASREQFGDRQGVAQAYLRLGDVACARRDLSMAREHYLQALKLYRESADRGGRALCQAALARVEAAEGDAAAARARYLQALDLAEAIGYAAALAEVYLGVARIQAGDGDTVGAATLLCFLGRAPNVPVPVRKQAEVVLDGLNLGAAARAQAEREATALDAAAMGKAVRASLQKPGTHQHIVTAIETDLTRREMQVLALLDRGYTNNAVATELGLTVSTVKWYCTQIFGKLGASNRTEALARARELGLLA